MAQLEGKVAIVTGASKGIGAAIAEKIAENGARVVVSYANDAAGAEAVVQRINSSGGKAVPVRADLSKPGEAGKLVAASLAAFGQLNILVNNAGVYEFRPLAEVNEEHFTRMFDLNVKGLLFATQAAASAFDGKGGSVINISSIASQASFPATSVYSASKAAVDALTRTLAAELGPRKILVNSILPGPVETQGTRSLDGWDALRAQFLSRSPLGRIGEPDDIARVALFLASEEARWITGQVIPVAGGLQ